MRKTALACYLSVCLLCWTTGAQNKATDQPPQQSAAEMAQQALGAFRAGDFELAIRKYNEILARDPKSAEAYAGLAEVYLKRDDLDRALENANKGLAQPGESLPAHVALGDVYFRQGLMAEAEREFLKAVNTPHPLARGYFGLVRLYDAYSFHAKARQMLEKAHALDPDDPEIQYRWTETLTRAQRIKWLVERLAGNQYDDADTRDEMRTSLEYLRAREAQPQLRCKLTNKLQSAEAPLEALLLDTRHLYGYGLNVKVNGHSSRLLLDTGAGGIFINHRLAEKAGIEPLLHTTTGGIGDRGGIKTFIGYAKSIKIGQLEFENCLVEVSEGRTGLDADGLIGADVFSDFLVTIDFLWHKLRLDELPRRPGESEGAVALAQHDDQDEDAQAPRAPQDRYIAPEMQNYTKIFRFGHMLLIPTRVGETVPKLFLIDTGAMFSSITPRAAREVTKVHRDDTVSVRGLSGEVKDVFSADKAELMFSHFRQQNQDLTAFDTSRISRDVGVEISGILGFATLRQFNLKIDYRDGLVDFIYNGELPKKK